MNRPYRTQIADGVYFNSIKDNRFKTMRITVNVILPLSLETASQNALLSQVITRSCNEYPDFTALSKKLSELYGASLYGGFSKAGDNQILTMSISGLDDKYTINKENISQKLSKLLCTIIFDPYITDNRFSKDELEQERRQVLEMVDAEFNDKRQYSVLKAIEIMYEDETFGIRKYGNTEKINQVTDLSLYEAWQNMLKNAVFEIMLIGDVDENVVSNVFKNEFIKIERNPIIAKTKIVRTVKQVKEKIEEMEIAQSKLIMCFTTDCAYPDNDVMATKLMTAILGGTASSKLFNNVREKLSLCYYCASRVDTTKGFMMIESGVEAKNIDKAKQAILNEIEDMQNGIISDFEIEATKMAVCNSYYTTNDTVGGLEAWYAAQLLYDEKKTSDEMANEINAITKEQIINAAKKLMLDTTFILKPVEQ